MPNASESIDIGVCRALVEEADKDPATVVDRAAAMLDGIADDQLLTHEQAVCAWALGLAARHLRQLDRSRAWLDRASAALDVGTADHTGVELTRSSTLVYQGELDQAVAVLEATQPDEDLAPRVVCQLATVNEFRGDLALAEAGYTQAIAGFLKTGDAKGEAHALTGLGLVNVARGQTALAIHRFSLARTIYRDLGDNVLAAVLQSNVGWAAAQADDLVTALEHLTEAGRQLKASGAPFAETALEHALVLLKAGLPGEAIGVIGDVLPQLEAAGSNTDRAELLMTFGQAFVGYGRPGDARRCFRAAQALFEHQGRSHWTQAAELRQLELDISSKADTDLVQAARRALEIADALSGEMSTVSVDALVAAGRAASLGQDLATLRLVGERVEGTEIQAPLLLLLLRCFLLEADGQPDEIVEVVLDHLGNLSTTSADHPLDVRAGIAMQSDELIQIGVRAALRSRNASAIAEMIQYAKNPLISNPKVIADQDELGAELRAALRQDLDAKAWRRISEHVRTIESPALPVRETTPPLLPASAVMATVTDNTIVVVQVDQGHSTLLATHDYIAVDEAFQRHRLLLETAVLDAGTHLLAALRTSAEAIRELLPWLRHDRLDLVLTGSLGDAPWTSVALGPVRLVVNPHGRTARGERNRHLIAVGPDTATARLEAALVRSRLRQPVDLSISDATAASVIEAAPDLDVLHLACHADHDHENPLLSGYLLHDGRLRGYEIERLAGAPRVVISSACSAGKQQPRGQMQMLGLPATWLAAGADAVIAPSCPIPDDARTTETMAELHRLITAGTSPEQAVLQLRATHDELVARTLVTFGRVSPATRSQN